MLNPNGVLIISNNPLVKGILSSTYRIDFIDGGYEDVLIKVRDKVYLGHELLSHPLSGSVKPHETPYKSVLVSIPTTTLDAEMADIISTAIETAQKFEHQKRELTPKIHEDFQLIDYTLIASALDYEAIQGLNHMK